MERIVVITSKFNIITGDRNECYSKNERERFDKEWIFNRMSIFMRFTAQCLINQTDQSFFALYAYEDTTEMYIEQALSNHPKLPDNIIFVKKSEYIEMLDKLTDGYDMLLLSRLDSDDLYSDDFVETLMEYNLKDDTEELLCQNGYIYDSVNNKLAEYYHKQFTFYTFVYKLGKEADRYSSLEVSPMELLIGFSHFRTIDYKYEVLTGRKFMFMIHGHNTNSKFSDYNYGFNRVERFITNQQDVEDILYGFL